jgi:hypothetical protein
MPDQSADVRMHVCLAAGIKSRAIIESHSLAGQHSGLRAVLSSGQDRHLNVRLTSGTLPNVLFQSQILTGHHPASLCALLSRGQKTSQS